MDARVRRLLLDDKAAAVPRRVASELADRLAKTRDQSHPDERRHAQDVLQQRAPDHDRRPRGRRKQYRRSADDVDQEQPGIPVALQALDVRAEVEEGDSERRKERHNAEEDSVFHAPNEARRLRDNSRPLLFQYDHGSDSFAYRHILDNKAGERPASRPSSRSNQALLRPPARLAAGFGGKESALSPATTFTPSNLGPPLPR